MAADLYCPKDYNLGDIREDQCNVGGIPCPDPLPVDPAKVVKVSCGPCGRQWGIPVGDIMKGRMHGKHSCQLQACAAQIIPSDEVEALKAIIEVREQAISDLQAAPSSTTRTQPVPPVQPDQGIGDFHGDNRNTPKAKPVKK